MCYIPSVVKPLDSFVYETNQNLFTENLDIRPNSPWCNYKSSVLVSSLTSNDFLSQIF